ncbi:MAG: SseB family protein [Legionella sp.]|uniref:SseB family protein n=1 Tax=Legionella sp. TaxID=459 RepID=UPI0039E45CAE
MNALDQAIKEAFKTAGNTKEANKAYIEFIKANFIIPIERTSAEKEPQVLFLQEQNEIFLPVFTKMSYLDAWAGQITQEINILKLSGVDLIKGIGENVTVCLNIGSDTYKEFNASEIARMRSLVLKFFKD